jgi:hypothetical protein
LSIALADADHDKLVEAVEDFAQTRAALFEATGSTNRARFQDIS